MPAGDKCTAARKSRGEMRAGRVDLVGTHGDYVALRLVEVQQVWVDTAGGGFMEPKMADIASSVRVFDVNSGASVVRLDGAWNLDPYIPQEAWIDQGRLNVSRVSLAEGGCRFLDLRRCVQDGVYRGFDAARAQHVECRELHDEWTYDPSHQFGVMVDVVVDLNSIPKGEGMAVPSKADHSWATGPVTLPGHTVKASDARCFTPF
jgi:hypothetical protein